MNNKEINNIVSAMRAKRREEEISTYGKSISFITRVKKSKKLYSRKNKFKKENYE